MRRRIFLKGRRIENATERYSHYHVARNDHPNYRDFGTPHYTDDEGREYRLAKYDFVRTAFPHLRSDRRHVKLYVRLPPGTSWFSYQTPRVAVMLYSVVDREAMPRRVVIRERFLTPGHRTGHVYVSRHDFVQSAHPTSTSHDAAMTGDMLLEDNDDEEVFLKKETQESSLLEDIYA